MMTKQQVQIIELEPLMIDAKTACRICSVSERLWYTLISTGQAPPSVKLGGRRLWKLSTVRQWVEWDLPNIDRFKILSEQGAQKCAKQR